VDNAIQTQCADVGVIGREDKNGGERYLIQQWHTAVGATVELF
jgi:hypothetical protein